MKNNSNKIAYDSISILVANIISYIISFAVSILLIRYLGSIKFGQYTFIIAFISFFGFLGDLGIGRLLIREISRNKENSNLYLGNFLILQFILSIFTFFLIMIFINLLNYPEEIKTYIYVTGMGISIYLISRVFETIITAYEYIQYNALISISYKIINSFSIFAVIIIFHKGILELAIAFLITNVLITYISGAICLKKCCLPKFRIDFNQWKLYLIGGFDFGLINLFGAITASAGVILLSKIKGDLEVGLFNGAYKFPTAIIMIIASLDTMLYPLFSRQHINDKEKMVIYFKKAIRYASFIGFPIAIFFNMFSNQIIFTFLGGDYLGAIPAIRILIWIVPFVFLSAICHIALTSMNIVRPVTIIMGLSSIIYFIMNIIFQQKYGYLALCWSTLFVSIFTIICFNYFINRTILKFNLFIYEILPPIVLSCILFFIFSIFSQFKIDNIWLISLFYAIAYLVFLPIFLLMDDYDRSLLKTLIKHFIIKTNNLHKEVI